MIRERKKNYVFFGVFDIEDRRKHIKYIQNIICKYCNGMSSYELIKVYTIFHFFFIPIFKWNKRYYLISRCCNSIFQVSLDLASELENSNSDIIDDSKLELIGNSYNGRIQNVCGNCKNKIEASFEYCPYCGNKLK